MRTVETDTDVIPSYLPLPGLGLLPVNAFLIRAAEPVLVDTGLAALQAEFLTALRSQIAPEDLRWIWLTHADPDHLGNLAAVLREAPNARVVTTFLGMGKMSLQQVPVDRTYLLNPGQSMEVGDRRLLGVRPPCFDAPETTGVFDTKTGVLFSSDCFGALMSQPAETAAQIAAPALREGLVTWATIDAPWLDRIDPGSFERSLDVVRKLEPHRVLSSHLPPATGMTETLLAHLAGAPAAPAFNGPDQAAFEQMMASLEPVG